MSTDLALSLLELIALALPAVGIYMQILAQVQGIGDKSEMGIPTSESLGFSLTQRSLRTLVFSGIILVIYLISSQPPTLFPNYSDIVGDLMTFSLYLAMTLLGYSLVLVALSLGLDTYPFVLKDKDRHPLRQYLHSKWHLLKDKLRDAQLTVVELSGGDTARRIQKDLRNFADTGLPDSDEVSVEDEKMARRIVDRGWAESYRFDEANSNYSVSISDFGRLIREDYGERFASGSINSEDPIRSYPVRYLAELEREYEKSTDQNQR